MRATLMIVIALFLCVVVCVCFYLISSWYQGRRPADMPRSSVWIEAPAVPFGLYHGWWMGCWFDSATGTDRCRLWGSGGTGKVYEGEYTPCAGHSPLLDDALILVAPQNSFDMWVS